jgi:hypothetical protein
MCQLCGGLISLSRKGQGARVLEEEAMRHLVPIAVAAAALAIPAAGLAAQRTAVDSAGDRLAQMCSEGSRDISGLQVDQFQRIIGADDAKRAALDGLANASVRAAQEIRTACAMDTPPTAPGRLAAMRTRLEAMIAAVAIVRPALEKFYGLLSDEQKEEIIALGERERQSRNASLLDQDCASAQPAGFPSVDVERSVHPTEAQRPSLVALQEATAKAAEVSKDSCPSDKPLTPTARLAALGKRLDALLQAVNTVIPPLNDFYAMLDDRQQARFNGISLPQTTQSEQPKGRPAVSHRHHYVSIGGMIRRFLRLF